MTTKSLQETHAQNPHFFGCGSDLAIIATEYDHCYRQVSEFRKSGMPPNFCLELNQIITHVATIPFYLVRLFPSYRPSR